VRRASARRLPGDDALERCGGSARFPSVAGKGNAAAAPVRRHGRAAGMLAAGLKKIRAAGKQITRRRVGAVAQVTLTSP